MLLTVEQKKTKNKKKSGDFSAEEKSKNQEFSDQIRRFDNPVLY
jgi:hypothetical protein